MLMQETVAEVATDRCNNCAWGSDDARSVYLQVVDQYGFHTHCNFYGTLKRIGDVTGMKILDIPSGPGVYASALLKRGAAVVTSVDIDPGFIAACEDALRNVPNKTGKWHGIAADASIPAQYPGGPFDIVRANFLLENMDNLEDMEACARNLYSNLKPGARYVGMWAPGAHSTEDRKVIRDVVAMDTSDIAGMKPGDKSDITYMAIDGVKVVNWYYWPVRYLRECLEKAGFVDVKFENVEVDPEYHGTQDLHRFVRHIGNKYITARIPPETGIARP